MENYFWNVEEQIEEQKVYVLIIYDIVNNSRRVKFAKKMNGYGFRVQKSAFEAKIKKSLYRKLLREIPESINKEEDSVRIYKIIGSGEVTFFGINDTVKMEDVLII